MTIAKIFILVVLVGVFVFTAYKLVMQIREYLSKKKGAKQDDSNKVENTNKEV